MKKDVIWLVASCLMAIALLLVSCGPIAPGEQEEEGEITMDISMSCLEYNHNKPVSIAMPPGAEEAIEMPGPTEVPSGLSSDEEEWAEIELANVQAAVYAMMVDNGLETLPNPVGIATNDMSAFPDTSVCGIDKIQDTNGNLYIRGKDKDGYFLYQHDITGDGAQTVLVNYLASQYSMGTYTVDSSGTVTQVTTGYE